MDEAALCAHANACWELCGTLSACDVNVDARAWLDWSGSLVKVAIEDAALQHSHNEAHRRMFADSEAYRCGAERVDISKRASCKAQS